MIISNQELIQNWKLEHALSYVFLSIANSDCDIDAEELLEIKNILYYYTKSDEITSEYLKLVLPVIQNHDVDTKKEMLSVLKDSFFTDKKALAEVLDNIEEIIIADLIVKESEMELYHFVKKLFKS